ncbi:MULTISPECIES: ABC transporter permease [Ensifer]|uniref:Autoinducer 2 import system permease protein LsrD n=1 Tax=Ensifer canadensis TaxID=555315 RepID=A0AAW4FEG5_9HYPH|nr:MULTISPECIES: ABC transporter permease [Ensifer]KQU90678.1 ABC transporter permease [Ensifer sp. Root31]KQW50281.1 ABC transporter permease [Ensifer sp. Root1252]KQW67428.1 ABC transporter permease [Ensifer sp. Root127]KRC74505.1 ABC transporter permease [Ensifer sp. Root231]KRD03218.1 ABC transporter permease [Ensifer sp. Root258]
MNTAIFTKRPTSRIERYSPALLLAAALLIYIAIALSLGLTRFLTPEAAISILNRSIALGMTAVGQTFAILVGSIDLSVAHLISASAVVSSAIMNGDPAMMVPAVLAVLLMGVLVGTLNGLLIIRLEVNPLIATLGMALIIQGCLASFHGKFAGSVPDAFQFFAYGTVLGLPFSLIMLALVVLAAWVLLRFTRFGSNIYSVGGNRDTARAAGIKTGRVVMASHIICSLCASLAGLYLASRLKSGSPWIGTEGAYDLESIAVVVIGGTILSGGKGGIWGTVAGVIIFSLIDSIFNLAGVDAFAKQVMRGIIIVAAVAFYAVRSKRIVA